MIADSIPQLRTFGAAQKLELAAELWEDVLRHEDQIDDPPMAAAVLEERLARYRAREIPGRSWDEVRAAIQKKN